MMHNVPTAKYNLEEMRFCGSLIKLLLSKLNCQDHYRVELESERLYLRESSTVPPTRDHRLKIQSMMEVLKARQMIQFSRDVMRVEKDNTVTTVTYWRSESINIQKIKQALKMREGDHLDNVDSTLLEELLKNAENEESLEQSNHSLHLRRP